VTVSYFAARQNPVADAAGTLQVYAVPRAQPLTHWPGATRLFARRIGDGLCRQKFIIADILDRQR
jgi:hypothetical protein